VSLAAAFAIVGAGLLVGLLSGVLGVGGGILMVPFMVLALGETPHVAEGTSLLVIVPAAVFGVLTHRRTGQVSFRHAAWLAAGGIVGAYTGAVLALRLPGQTLRQAFGVLVGAVGLYLFVKGIRGRRRFEPRAPRSREGTTGGAGGGGAMERRA
jgi:uncharacterized protein